GLAITAGGSTVRGLAIGVFGSGITLQNGGGNHITGNFIGTYPSGTQGSGNDEGVYISNSAGNVGGGADPGDRNTMSGHARAGIHITGADASGNLIQGNYIGTDKTGTQFLGNGAQGVWVESDVGGGNTIGGTAAGAGNLISGNRFEAGIKLDASGNLVQGN